VGGFEAHLDGAETFEVFGLEILVAGLDDVITSKETLARDKDTSIWPSCGASDPTDGPDAARRPNAMPRRPG